MRDANSDSVNSLCSATAGTTLQFVADIEFLESCYENSASLLWRDSGALAMTICMVATSLGMTSVVLGRVGSSLLGGKNFSDRFVGAGAVHWAEDKNGSLLRVTLISRRKAGIVKGGVVLSYIGFLLTGPASNWLIQNVGTHCVPNGPCFFRSCQGYLRRAAF